MFFGYFDPENILLIMKILDFRGYQPNISAKNEPLTNFPVYLYGYAHRWFCSRLYIRYVTLKWLVLLWKHVCTGSKYPKNVWFYFEFKINGAYYTHVAQDGAATANNPSIVAVQEARMLFPDSPIDCVVSLGCGSTPPRPRPRGMSTYLDTGNMLIESACNVYGYAQCCCFQQ